MRHGILVVDLQRVAVFYCGFAVLPGRKEGVALLDKGRLFLLRPIAGGQDESRAESDQEATERTSCFWSIIMMFP